MRVAGCCWAGTCTVRVPVLANRLLRHKQLYELWAGLCSVCEPCWRGLITIMIVIIFNSCCSVLEILQHVWCQPENEGCNMLLSLWSYFSTTQWNRFHMNFSHVKIYGNRNIVKLNFDCSVQVIHLCCVTSFCSSRYFSFLFVESNSGVAFAVWSSPNHNSSSLKCTCTQTIPSE